MGDCLVHLHICPEECVATGCSISMSSPPWFVWARETRRTYYDSFSHSFLTLSNGTFAQFFFHSSK